MPEDFFEFIRLKIAIFTGFFAMSGHLLFNPLSSDLLLAGLSAFLACAGAASYNNITDVKEDAINRKKTNKYAQNPKSRIISASCMIGGLYSAYLFSLTSAMLYTIMMSLLIAYSYFRVKRHILIKNIYTALGNSMIFLVGAGVLYTEALVDYAFIAGFVLIGSIISDMRDLEGDKKANIRTLPAVMGYEKTKTLTYILAAAFSMLLAGAGPGELAILLPFTLLMAAMIKIDRIKTAHALVGVPFVLLTLMLAA